MPDRGDVSAPPPFVVVVVRFVLLTRGERGYGLLLVRFLVLVHTTAAAPAVYSFSVVPPRPYGGCVVYYCYYYGGGA